jgi:DNA-binding beta-propeller fold protein YncE
MEFESNGNFVRAIGDGALIRPDGFVWAHGVRVDAEDNIWFVDEGSHNVIKFAPDGRILLNVGRRPTINQIPHPGAAPPEPDDPRNPTDADELFYRPTDVAFGTNGDFFVSDGYGHARIVKFDKDGNWVKTWGKKGVAPDAWGTGPGEFHTPHSVVVDAKGLLYVADRQNKRIQIFDSAGNYQREWNHIGGGEGFYPWALCLTDPPNQVMYMADGSAGRVVKLDLNGNVLGAFGRFGRALGQFNHAHAIACAHSDPNTVYVGETRTFRFQKLILKPVH